MNRQSNSKSRKWKPLLKSIEKEVNKLICWSWLISNRNSEPWKKFSWHRSIKNLCKHKLKRYRTWFLQTLSCKTNTAQRKARNDSPRKGCKGSRVTDQEWHNANELRIPKTDIGVSDHSSSERFDFEKRVPSKVDHTDKKLGFQNSFIGIKQEQRHQQVQGGQNKGSQWASLTQKSLYDHRSREPNSEG